MEEQTKSKKQQACICMLNHMYQKLCYACRMILTVGEKIKLIKKQYAALEKHLPLQCVHIKHSLN